MPIDTEPPCVPEIMKALRKLKAGKCPGIDNVSGEMLKADMTTTVQQLGRLYENIWETESIPSDWQKGVIVKIPKKGDPTKCDNWRGVTLLSIPSKVLCNIIIERISAAVDKHLHKEQAGFPKGRGCTRQIFILRNIIEQCYKWNATLCLNLINFEKGFDSVHREGLWAIMKSYGIPDKITTLAQLFYRN